MQIIDPLPGSATDCYTYSVHPTANPASKKAVAEVDADYCGATRLASNDEDERQAAVVPSIGAA